MVDRRTTGVGVSRSEESVRATEESIVHATRDLPGEADLIVSWVTEGYDAQLVAETASRYAPNTCGCSAWGSITREGVLTRGITTIAWSCDRQVIGPAVSAVDSGDPAGSGGRLGSALFADAGRPRSGCGIVFTNAPEHGHELVAGFYDAVGPEISFCGCATRDAASRRYVYADGQLVENGALAVVFADTARIEPVVRHGWEPFGPPALATRAADGALLLDGKPAWEMYLDLLPEERTGFLGAADDATDGDSAAYLKLLGQDFPLGMPLYSGQYVVYDAEFTPGERYPVCRSAVFEGSLVRIMHGTDESLLRALEAGVSACGGLEDATAVIGATCLSRLRFYGGGYETELEVMRSTVPSDVPLALLPAHGEIGSVDGGPASFFHKSVTILPLRSEER